MHAKMNDDEDDELPHFEADDDEEGAEQPALISWKRWMKW